MGLNFSNGFLDDFEAWEQLSLLGFLISNKVLNQEAFKTSMQTLWKLHNIVDFKEIGPNLYIVEFKGINDLKKVLEVRLWSFDRYLFCITDFNHNIVPQELPFNRELF